MLRIAGGRSDLSLWETERRARSSAPLQKENPGVSARVSIVWHDLIGKPLHTFPDHAVQTGPGAQAAGGMYFEALALIGSAVSAATRWVSSASSLAWDW